MKKKFNNLPEAVKSYLAFLEDNLTEKGIKLNDVFWNFVVYQSMKNYLFDSYPELTAAQLHKTLEDAAAHLSKSI